MKRVLLASAVFALAVTAVAVAQDPPPDPARPVAKAKAAQAKAAILPAQPGAVQPAQPNPWGTSPAALRTTAAKLGQYEEEFETLEAHRDVRKAIVRAAEVSVKAADMGFERISKVNAASREEVDKAKLEVEAARAQLEIRIAEMKEVEVKIKHAKKRVDEAKAAAAAAAARVPAGKFDPKPVDPPPPVSPSFTSDDNVDDNAKQIEELKAKLAKLTAEATKAAEVSKKADAVAKEAADELAKIKEVAKRGRVRPGTIEAAEEKAAAAQAAADKAKKAAKALEDEIAGVKLKLKEIEK